MTNFCCALKHFFCLNPVPKVYSTTPVEVLLELLLLARKPTLLVLKIYDLEPELLVMKIYNLEPEYVPSCSTPIDLTPVSTPGYCDGLKINETSCIRIATHANKNDLDTLKGFRIAHLNITSIPKYIGQLRIYLVNKPLDILTINETRLDESISNVEVNIQGYNLWRKDRCRYGGGVAIYTRDILNAREVSQFVPEHIESVCLEIIKPKSKPFLVTAVYRPPIDLMQIVWMN